MGSSYIVRRGGIRITQEITIQEELIVLYFGVTTDIPSGFQLCDGTNGTPDLRNRFIIGAGDIYNINDTGGSADAIVVSHNHTVTTNSSGAHTHTIPTETANNPGGSVAFRRVNNATSTVEITTTASDFEHSHTVSVDNAGESGTGKNLPPYYGLLYLIKKEAIS